MEKRIFTSESVSMGHPDKVADLISDSILDAILAQDPNSRVACETMVTTGLVVIAGEITTRASIDYIDVAREAIRYIGYTDSKMGFSYDCAGVICSIKKQSPDISQGVTEGQGLHQEQGAGDQGMMFGYACKDTPELMPFPIYYAHRIVEKLAELRQSGEVSWLGPDGKCQVSVEYDGWTPVRVDTVVISTQHSADVSYDTIRKTMIEKVAKKVIPAKFLDAKTIYHINPTGRFVVGGPAGDVGLTGRKIIVDTYGGMGKHGGGCFSGKDPSKVDRSAAYAARWVAKNIVAADLADRAEVELAYAIGVAKPVAIRVDTFGTGKISDSKITELVREHFDLTPKGIITSLQLKQPIYRETAHHGHFGRSAKKGFTWERTDKAAALASAAGLKKNKKTPIVTR